MCTGNIVQSFESFFQGWLIRQEKYLEELEREIINNNGTVAEENEARHKELISRVLEHYIEYYATKARVVAEDVFLFFCPPWLRALERFYLWLARFRPGLAFRLLSCYVLDLTEDQSRRIHILEEEIKRDVQELTDVLAGVQGGMAASTAVPFEGHVRNGEVAHQVSTIIDRFRVSMEALVECADYLRGKTLVKNLEILSSSQAMRFLAAAAQFQFSIRRYAERPSKWP